MSPRFLPQAGFLADIGSCVPAGENGALEAAFKNDEGLREQLGSGVARDRG